MVMFYSLLKEETLTSLIKWLFFISILLSSTIANAQTFNGKQTVKDFVVEGLTASLGVYTNVSKKLTSTPPTTGVLGYFSRTGTEISTATAGDDITTSGQGEFNNISVGTDSPAAGFCYNAGGTVKTVLME